MPTSFEGGGRPTTSAEGDLPEYVVDELLESERCRLMLELLEARAEPIVLDDLMRAVVAAERGVDPEAIGREERARARIEAYEHHLPRLTAVGVVRYDSLLGTVELTDSAVTRRVRNA